MMYEIFDIKDGIYVVNYFEDTEFKCVPRLLYLSEDEFYDFKVGKKEV